MKTGLKIGIGLVAATLLFTIISNMVVSGNTNHKTVDSGDTISNIDPEQTTMIDSQPASAESVIVVDTCGLRVYYPQYSTIDLVCGTMPSKNDSDVIMFAEAAFTGELLDEFKHSNIAGDHVTNGKRERGFRCKRNTGAFIYYDGKAKFIYPNFSNEL